MTDVYEAFDELDAVMVATICPGITAGQARKIVDYVLELRELRERFSATLVRG